MCWTWKVLGNNLVHQRIVKAEASFHHFCHLFKGPILPCESRAKILLCKTEVICQCGTALDSVYSLRISKMLCTSRDFAIFISLNSCLNFSRDFTW